MNTRAGWPMFHVYARYERRASILSAGANIEIDRKKHSSALSGQNLGVATVVRPWERSLVPTLRVGMPVFDAPRRFDPRNAERPGQYVPTQSMGTRYRRENAFRHAEHDLRLRFFIVVGQS